MKWKSLSCVWLFAAPWTAASQVPLSVEILQVRILEWVAMPSTRGSSQPRDRTQVSHIAGGFFTRQATRKAIVLWYTYGQMFCMCGHMVSPVWLSVTLWTVACQAPLSMGFPRQEYWSGLHFLLQGTFSTQGLNQGLPHCRQTLPFEPPGVPLFFWDSYYSNIVTLDVSSIS